MTSTGVLSPAEYLSVTISRFSSLTDGHGCVGDASFAFSRFSRPSGPPCGIEPLGIQLGLELVRFARAPGCGFVWPCLEELTTRSSPAFQPRERAFARHRKAGLSAEAGEILFRARSISRSAASSCAARDFRSDLDPGPGHRFVKDDR